MMDRTEYGEWSACTLYGQVELVVDVSGVVSLVMYSLMVGFYLFIFCDAVLLGRIECEILDLVLVAHVFHVCEYFLFFKQKTAYEMRISDWSSDVCSSD